MTKPPRSRRPKQRSTGEWALRGGIAVIALLLGYVSLTQTLAYAIRNSNAERAFALAGGDGRIASELSEKLAVAQAEPAQRARTDKIAHQALMNEPLAVSALTALGLNSQRRGDLRQARRLFTRSDTLSRRDLATRLWLIEDAVARGDVPGTLRHYDIALRTGRNAPELLFPVLAGAVADPEISTALANTLSKRPPWGDAFVQYLSISGPNAKATAGLFRKLAIQRTPIPEIASANAVNSLITANAFTDAWNYYRSLRSGIDRRQSRDPDFGAQLEIPTAFDWTPVMIEAGITASIQRTSNDGMFDFAAPATVGGVVLQQMQVLPAGSYRIEGRSAGIEQPEGSLPYWTLVCTDGREFGRVNVPSSSKNEGRFQGTFTVGSNCPAQLLRLSVRPSNSISGASGQIDRVALRPL